MPSYTSTVPRSVTVAQQRLIASLADERVLTTELEAGVGLAASGAMTSRDASSLIGTLMDLPRATTPRGDDTRLRFRPSENLRAGRMLLAGGVEATVTLPDGRHITVTIRTRVRSGRGWANGTPGVNAARTSIRVLGARLGWLSVDSHGLWSLHLRTRRPEYRQAITAVLLYASGISTDGLIVQEASRCGRCHRTLTDPVSIQRGIGPECYGRSTGSQHVRADNETGAADRHEFSLVDRVTPQLERLADSFAVLGTDARANTAIVQRALAADTQRARDLIAEALDAYCTDQDDCNFAMGVFDRLAAKDD